MRTAKAVGRSLIQRRRWGCQWAVGGPRFSPGAEVLDPLIAQAVVIEDEKGYRTVWISIDMIGMTWHVTSRLRCELAAIVGIPFEAIIVNFSHTHSGPMSGFEGYATTVAKPVELEAYESDLLSRTIKMVVEAIENMREVSVCVYRGTSEIGINRRRRGADGSMGMRPNPDGYMNRDLWVLDLSAEDGRCVLFNYGCHPVMVYGFAWDGISADFPGVCRNRLVGISWVEYPRAVYSRACGQYSTAPPRGGRGISQIYARGCCCDG